MSTHEGRDSRKSTTSPPLPSTQGIGQTVSFAQPSQSTRPGPSISQRLDSSGHSLEASTATLTSGDGSATARKKKHRGGKKRRNRRQSFAATVEDTAEEDDRPSLGNTAGRSRTDDDRVRDHSFYRLRTGKGSNESLGSEHALLDHRDHPSQRARRQSITERLKAPSDAPSPRNIAPRQAQTLQHVPMLDNNRSRSSRTYNVAEGDDDIFNDFSPLIQARRGTPGRSPNPERGFSTSYFEGPSSSGSHGKKRRGSRNSSKSSKRNHHTLFERQQSTDSLASNFDINNPPSRPSSPMLEEANAYDEVMLRNHGDVSGRSPENGRKAAVVRDLLIDIEEHAEEATARAGSTPPSPGRSPQGRGRRGTLMPAEGDVCFPQEGMSEIGEDDFSRISEADSGRRRRNRRRRGVWPDLAVLEEWGIMEKEERTMEGIRSRRIHEPILVDGRLRPSTKVWHREEENPLRFTYFNEEFDNTLHASALCELMQDGMSFRNLFIPDPPELSDSDTDEDDDATQRGADDTSVRRVMSPTSTSNGHSRSRQESLRQEPTSSRSPSVVGKVTPPSGSEHPSRQESPGPSEPPMRSVTPTPALGQTIGRRKKYGPRPIWWLDVLCPTDAEIRVIGKAFGIHPLTQEDIVTQEPREKIEMFKHYYFMNYRTFEQDSNNENYLEPMNFYTVVFGEGVLTFHFSQTPHPANVRRRIRVLTDYLIPTSDWISYAIIDNITDVYVPLIQKIEDEVDMIDEAILGMHDVPEQSMSKNNTQARRSKKRRNARRNWLLGWLFSGQRSQYDYHAIEDEDDQDRDEKKADDLPLDDTGDMLRRTGECRKKVMGLYRLLGNKADVIKGFAKRCNEQWDVAPRSEIGLYLGDIQDHIVTMTGNLSHYENLLSRAHSNYLAQINIRMNERAERTNDILGKLTVVGTIVLPMNIVTGLWGMNCIVPGQEVENLNWFYALTAFLVLYALISYMVAKKVYGIV